MGKSSKAKKVQKGKPLQTAAKAVKAVSANPPAATIMAPPPAPVVKTAVMPVMSVPTMALPTAPTAIVPPPAPPKVAENKPENSMLGYIIHHQMDNGDNKFLKITKVLTDQGKIINLFKPAVKLPLYSRIKFTPGQYNGKMTVENPSIVAVETPLQALMAYIEDPDVQAQPDIRSIGLDELLSRFITSTHVGSNTPEVVANFLNNVTGNGYIIGITGNKLFFSGGDSE